MVALRLFTKLFHEVDGGFASLVARAAPEHAMLQTKSIGTGIIVVGAGAILHLKCSESLIRYFIAYPLCLFSYLFVEYLCSKFLARRMPSWQACIRPIEC